MLSKMFKLLNNVTCIVMYGGFFTNIHEYVTVSRLQTSYLAVFLSIELIEAPHLLYWFLFQKLELSSQKLRSLTSTYESEKERDLEAQKLLSHTMQGFSTK